MRVRVHTSSITIDSELFMKKSLCWIIENKYATKKKLVTYINDSTALNDQKSIKERQETQL